MVKMLEAHPEAAFIMAKSCLQAEISKLNKLAVSAVDSPEATRAIDQARVEKMTSLNAAIAEMEKANGKMTLADRLKKVTKPLVAEVSP
jgi:hypothetical protein